MPVEEKIKDFALRVLGGNIPEKVKTFKWYFSSYKQLPSDFVSTYKNLETLIIKTHDKKNNEFEELPSNLGELSELEEIHIENTKLKKIPNLSGLTNLKRLYLSDNYIEEIPESIGDLKKLNIVTLMYNNLQTIPESIKDIGTEASWPSMKILKLGNNNIRYISPETVKHLFDEKGSRIFWDLYANDFLYLGNGELILNESMILDSFAEKIIPIREYGEKKAVKKTLKFLYENLTEDKLNEIYSHFDFNDLIQFGKDRTKQNLKGIIDAGYSFVADLFVKIYPNETRKIEKPEDSKLWY